MSFASPNDIAAWLTDTAAAFMRGPDNDIHLPGAQEPAFDLPLIGFAAGNDPIWDGFKEHVGSFHWTPAEAFAHAWPGEVAEPSELSVVCWVFPQTEATRKDHRKEKHLPSERWVRSRIFGEEFVLHGLQKHMVAALREKGVQAFAPTRIDMWKGVPSEQFVFASTWSERHAAYAAGLGTFGLCDGLITRKGKAIRLASIIVRLALPASERPYTDYQEYCLFYSSGICDACMKRCPADALSGEGHDKRKCKAFLDETRQYVKDTWNFAGYGCGLCQVAVPCENSVPPRPKTVSRPGA